MSNIHIILGRVALGLMLCAVLGCFGGTRCGRTHTSSGSAFLDYRPAYSYGYATSNSTSSGQVNVQYGSQSYMGYTLPDLPIDQGVAVYGFRANEPLLYNVGLVDEANTSVRVRDYSNNIIGTIPNVKLKKVGNNVALTHTVVLPLGLYDLELVGPFSFANLLLLADITLTFLLGLDGDTTLPTRIYGNLGDPGETVDNLSISAEGFRPQWNGFTSMQFVNQSTAAEKKTGDTAVTWTAVNPTPIPTSAVKIAFRF
jgi:hypothetical protein